MSDKHQKELNRLYAKREGLFRRIQLCCDAGKLLHSNKDQPQNLENFKIRYSRFQDTVSEYRELMQNIVETQQKINPDQPIKYEFLESFEDLCDYIQYTADLFLSKPVLSSNIDSTIVHQTRINMPKVDLMKFDGEDLTLWPLFYENFKHLVHLKSEFSPVEKLQFLLGSLTGKALKTCSAVAPIPDNYNIIWKMLEDTYQDNKYLANLYLDRIFNFRSQTNINQNTLQLFLEKFHVNVEALKRLKIEDLFDYVITYLAMTKLPSEVVSSYELIRDSNDIPTYDELIEFIRKQSKCIKFERPRSQNIATSTLKNNKSFFVNNQKASPVLCNQGTSITIKNVKPNCIICNENFHIISQCTKFLKLNPNSRFKLVKEKGICINCLNPYHKINNCPSQRGCNICKSRHHSLLHFDQSVSFQNKQNDFPTSSSSQSVPTQPQPGCSSDSNRDSIQSLCARETVSCAKVAKPTTVLLATVVVHAIDTNNHVQKIRLLLDSGSQSNFLTYNCCKRLGLNFSRTNDISVQGIGSAMQHIKGNATISFFSQYNHDLEYCMDVFIIDKITDKLPSLSIDISNLHHLQNLCLADNSYHVPGEVDGIIGVTLMADLILSEKISGTPGSPLAINTSLGYVVMGKVPVISESSIKTFCSFENLDHTIKKFWETEDIPSPPFLNQEEAECEEIFNSTVTRDTTGRYTVALPFKFNPENLGNSYDMAFRRFLALERKLEKNENLRIAYSKVMQDYIDQNHMSLTSSIDPNEHHYYIPHHPVFKVQSSSTPLRIVYDASAKSDNFLSLNDLLHSGPKLQKDIFALLLNFRLFPIALTADVKQMFRQIFIKPEHRKYQRLLWRFSADQPLSSYEINVVCFGVKSSPYLALRTVLQLAQDESSNYPGASKIVQDNFYVDDFVFSVESDDEAENVYHQTIQLFKAGQFELVKWASNSSALMAKIPDSLKLSNPLDFDETFKVLGLVWHPSTDYFSFRLGESNLIPTKRNVLSVVAQIFDPMGFLASITMYAKLLIKDYWALKLDWDQPPPKELEKRWISFSGELKYLSDLKIPRCLSLSSHNNVTLIGFADSSEKGYAGVIYLRSVNNGHISSLLVCAKSKVSPLKSLSLPRLELCAALLLTKLLSFVIATFSSRITISKIIALSDSTVVLHWLQSSPHRWNTFVANRVAKIQRDLPSANWYHISGALNVADSVSRGLTPSNFLCNQQEWFFGPSWLLLEENQWPIQDIAIDDRFSLEQKTVSLPTFEQKHCFILLSIERFSSYNKLLNTFVYVLRFCKLLPRQSSLSVLDLNKSEEVLIKCIQGEYFKADISALESKKPCSNLMLKLNPFLDERNILRVGGRLSNANISFDQQHPILLPNKCHFVDLLVDHYHQRHLHVGAYLLSSLIRQRFWIISGRNLIRRRIRLCNFCFRSNPKPLFPLMADLPAARVNQTKAFVHTGTDFAGPLRITISRHRGARCQKAYVCLFICLTTKAVHLELCSDLSTSKFMDAFKRFLSRRGSVSFMYSDCGSNYIGAKSELRDLYQFIKSSEYCESLKQELLKNQIIWKLNPPQSPHFGGIWESNIKTCKSILLKTIGQQILTYEELSTLLVQVEALMNSRPLYDISSDPSDPVALTPAHFLCITPLPHLPAPDLANEPENLSNRKLLLDKLLQSYWKRWHLEYLSTLQARLKWNTSSNPVKVGTVVVLVVDNIPPLQWPLGVITEIFPGSDGIIRVANIRTKSGIYKRPVVRLCPLPRQ